MQVAHLANLTASVDIEKCWPKRPLLRQHFQQRKLQITDNDINSIRHSDTHWDSQQGARAQS